MALPPEVIYISSGVLGGLSASAANNVIAYFNHFHKSSLGRCSNCCLFVFCQIFNLLSIVGFLAGAAFGPTAIVMPLVTASKLFSNMLFQHSVGIYTFSKPTRVGTYIVLVSVILLVQVGPSEEKQEVSSNEEALALLEDHNARRWLIGSTSALVLSLIGTCCYTSGKIHLILMCTAVALATALGACVGKFLFVVEGWLRVVAGLAYVTLGVFSFVWSFFASYTCSMAIFYPFEEFLQLAVNAVTGVYVWKELDTVKQPIAYFCVLFMIAIGVYLCTSFDIVETIAHSFTREQKESILKQGRQRFPMMHVLQRISSDLESRSNSLAGAFELDVNCRGTVVLELNRVWGSGANPAQVRAQFQELMGKSAITREESIQITADLAEALATSMQVLHRHVDEEKIHDIFRKMRKGRNDNGRNKCNGDDKIPLVEPLL